MESSGRLPARLNTRADEVRFENGLFRVRMDVGEMMEGDGLLVATGRRPNTEALHAPAAGIELDDRGFVRVNERLETTRPGVYAIGEAAG